MFMVLVLIGMLASAFTLLAMLVSICLIASSFMTDLPLASMLLHKFGVILMVAYALFPTGSPPIPPPPKGRR